MRATCMFYLHADCYKICDKKKSKHTATRLKDGFYAMCFEKELDKYLNKIES